MMRAADPRALRPSVAAAQMAALLMPVLLAALPPVAPAQPVPLPPSLDPGAVQQRLLDEQRRREQEERQRIPRVQHPLQAPEAAPARPSQEALAMRVRVGEITFTPSRFLSADELAALAKPLVGREVALAELLALVDRINALYAQRGIATARALLPAQEVTGGRVQIRLVEATLGRIGIDGNATTGEGFIVERVGIGPARVVDPRQLERDLIRFNRLYDAQLRARLEPGREVGTTDLLIAVLEPPRWGLRLAADNAGAPSSGRERLMASGSWRSPLGRRDEASLNLTLSAGTRGGSLGYTLPVTRWDTRLALLAARDDNDVVSGPFEPLNLNGDSTTVSASVRQPVVVNDRHVIEASLLWRDRDSKNRAEEIQLQRTGLSDWTLGLDSASVFGPLSLAAGLQWSEVDARVTDALGAQADRSYSVRRATLRGGWQLRPQWALRGALGVQRGSQTRLPAADQFFLGGDGTVRGYSASAVGGDRGVFANAELHHPVPRAWQPDWMQATGFAFYDYGRVKPFRPDSSPLPPYEQVRGVGWGINAQLGRAVFARLAVAHAIDEPQGETLGRTVWHAQASWLAW